MSKYTKKLQKLFDNLDSIRNEIEQLKETMEEDKTKIEEKAYERESGENTEKEQEKIDRLEHMDYELDDAINNLDTVKDTIEELMNE